MSDATLTTGPEPVQPPSRLRHLNSGRAAAAVKGWGWSFINIATTTLLAAAVFLVTSRVLTPVEFGAVALAVAVVSLIAAAIPMAFGDALIQRADLRPDHLDSVFWLSGGVATVAYAALFSLSPWIGEVSGVPVVGQILPVLGLRLLFEGFGPVPAALIHRRMQFRTVALRTMLANGLGATACLGLVAFGAPLWGLVISQVVSTAIALVVTFVAAGWRPSGPPRLTALVELSNFGLYAIAERLFTEARIDQLLLGSFVGAEPLGIFFFARRVFQMLSDLTAGALSSVSGVLFASLQTEIEKRRSAYLAASFASAALAFPVFSGLIVIAPTAIPFVFGDHWAGAVFAVQAFAAVGIMAGLGIMQISLIRAMGRADWCFWYMAIGQALNWLIILVLYPLGLQAIMAAFLLRTMLLWPVSVHKTQQLLQLGLAPYVFSVIGPAMATTFMAIAISLLPWAFPDLTGWVQLAAQIGTGALVYAVALPILSINRIRTLWAMTKARKAARA